jgi:hypothetical protein
MAKQRGRRTAQELLREVVEYEVCVPAEDLTERCRLGAYLDDYCRAGLIEAIEDTFNLCLDEGDALLFARPGLTLGQLGAWLQARLSARRQRRPEGRT